LHLISSLKSFFKYIELRTYLYLIVKNEWNIYNINLNYFYIKLNGTVAIRIKNIENENGKVGILNGVAMINAISRNIKVDKDIIKLNLSKSLDIEPINLRWIISSLDSVSNCHEFNINDRLLAQGTSIFLSQLKLYLDYKPTDKRNLMYGLTTFRKKGDVFFNQKNRLISLSKELDSLVSQYIETILKKLNELDIEGFSRI